MDFFLRMVHEADGRTGDMLYMKTLTVERLTYPALSQAASHNEDMQSLLVESYDLSTQFDSQCLGHRYCM